MQSRPGDVPSSKRQSAILPSIAPKSEKDPSPSADSQTDSGRSAGNVALRVPRTRLPPRSRNGCWTCRTRKVKCDEQRPKCLQCSRLGHECDYGPRLSFRDDTSRVIERMQEVSLLASHVWNPSASYPCRDRSPTPGEDLLPPFSSLANDEEREQKARLNQPGTYHVIANQRSFSNLPEYAAAKTADLLESGVGPNDPNTIVLQKFEAFEEPMARLSVQASRTTCDSPVASTPKSISRTSTPREGSASSFPDLSKLSLLEQAQNGGVDSYLLQHYRSIISHHIVQIGRTGRIQDMFEVQARTFLPLFHAMMALSALSLAHKTGIQNAVALEHYQKTIPAMRASIQSTQDSFCDGALFTHFLLMLYEVCTSRNMPQTQGSHGEIAASAEPWESNMWQEHLHHLSRIVTLRWQTNGAERHPFIVFMICAVDIYALLSSSGTGSFVEIVLKENMLPPYEDCLAPLVPGQPQMFYPEETPHFPALLELNQQVLLIAFEIGLLARDLRLEAQKRQQSDPSQITPEYVYVQQRRQRIKQLEVKLRAGRQEWIDKFPPYKTWLRIGDWENNFFLAPRVLAVCEHAYTLFRASLIYLHTSMYPSQIPLPETQAEIESCTADILLAARRIVSSARFELRYIVFPLFMAGYATPHEEEKKLSLELLGKMDRDSFGGNTNEIKKLLGTIHQLQRDTGGVVDWVQEMKSRGLKLVIFGL